MSEQLLWMIIIRSSRCGGHIAAFGGCLYLDDVVDEPLETYFGPSSSIFRLEDPLEMLLHDGPDRPDLHRPHVR